MGCFVHCCNLQHQGPEQRLLLLKSDNFYCFVRMQAAMPIFDHKMAVKESRSPRQGLCCAVGVHGPPDCWCPCIRKWRALAVFGGLTFPSLCPYSG